MVSPGNRGAAAAAAAAANFQLAVPDVEGLVMDMSRLEVRSLAIHQLASLAPGVLGLHLFLQAPVRIVAGEGESHALRLSQLWAHRLRKEAAEKRKREAKVTCTYEGLLLLSKARITAFRGGFHSCFSSIMKALPDLFIDSPTTFLVFLQCAASAMLAGPLSSTSLRA